MNNIRQRCDNKMVNIRFYSKQDNKIVYPVIRNSQKFVEYHINRFFLDSDIEIFIDSNQFDKIVESAIIFLHTGYINLRMNDAQIINNLQNFAKILKIDYLYDALENLINMNRIKNSETVHIIGNGDCYNYIYDKCFITYEQYVALSIGNKLDYDIAVVKDKADISNDNKADVINDNSDSDSDDNISDISKLVTAPSIKYAKKN